MNETEQTDLSSIIDGCLGAIVAPVLAVYDVMCRLSAYGSGLLARMCISEL